MNSDTPGNNSGYIISDPQPNPNNPTPPLMSGDGFRALFDFSFAKFISPSLIRIYYIVVLVVSLLVSIIGLVSCLINGGFMAVVGIILIPLLWVINLILVRMGLELVMVFFNLERSVRHIEKNVRDGGMEN